MKRYIALFTATLLLVANCIVYNPVKAVGTSVDFAEMFSEYLSLAEISMALSQGVEIDISNFEYPSDAQTNQEKAKALMSYYYSLLYRGVDYFLDLSGNSDIATEQVAAISLQSASNLSPDNIQDLRSQVAQACINYAVTGNWNVPIMQHYDDICIANWNKYNSMFINQYLSQMNYSEDEDPTPPAYSNTRVLTCNYSGNNNLYCTVGVNYQFTFQNVVFSNCKYPAALGIADAGWEGIYAFVGGSLMKNNTVESDNCLTYIANIGSDYFNIEYENVPIIEGAFYHNGNTLYMSEAARTYLETGVYTNSITTGLTFNIPDAVIDNSTDDGKIVAHPIYYPEAVKQDGLINIDLDSVRDTIIDAIANGRSTITMDDVVSDGAAVKIDGTTLTDTDTATLDVSIPIEAAKADTLTVPISAVPGLPKLPPIIPTVGSSDNIPNGFSGMSVLARIINVTVQSVPQPLIMCFFGVIFGMVVLGIIKILHH